MKLIKYKIKWLLAIAFLSSISISAQNWDELQKIVPSDPEDSYQFGFSTGISENYAIVGASNPNLPFGDNVPGAAYIFELDSNDNWSEVQILSASDPQDYALFGNAVAIHGNYAVVGALDRDVTPGTFDRTGGAYIFERQSNGIWTEVQLILGSNSDDNDHFGASVGIHGDLIIIGAHKSTTGAAWGGAVYIFKRDNQGIWQEIEYLLSPDPDHTDYFGWSVDISENHAVIGAPQEDDNPTERLRGAVYIFEKQLNGTWIQDQRVFDQNEQDNDYFGISVAIDNENIIIGSRQYCGCGELIYGKGKAHIYQKDPSGTWFEKQKLLASDGVLKNRFGNVVDIHGKIAVVGSGNLGGGYVFEEQANGDWLEIERLIPSDVAHGFGNIGWSRNLSVFGEYAIGGIDKGVLTGLDTGAAYIFKGANNICVGDLFIDEDVLAPDVDIQEAGGTITATNTIFSGATAEYDARYSVTMAVGFHARAGSLFRAYIDGCVIGGDGEDEKAIAKLKPNVADLNQTQDIDAKVLNVFPNPTKGSMQFISQDEMVAWEITNQVGNVRIGESLQNLKSVDVDLSRFSTGVYFLKVIFSDGEVQMKTIIKE